MEWLRVELFWFFCVRNNNVKSVPEFIFEHFRQLLIHLIDNEIWDLHATYYTIIILANFWLRQTHQKGLGIWQSLPAFCQGMTTSQSCGHMKGITRCSKPSKFKTSMCPLSMIYRVPTNQSSVKIRGFGFLFIWFLICSKWVGKWVNCWLLCIVYDTVSNP